MNPILVEIFTIAARSNWQGYGWFFRDMQPKLVRLRYKSLMSAVVTIGNFSHITDKIEYDLHQTEIMQIQELGKRETQEDQAC